RRRPDLLATSYGRLSPRSVGVDCLHERQSTRKEHLMDRSLKIKLAVGAVGGLAAAGAGGAIAATQLSSPQAENQAVVNDAAKQLGVQPSSLSNALKKALEDRVDSEVAAGRI